MNEHLLDDAMRVQLSQEWERLKRALSLAGDIGSLNLEDIRVVAERDRTGSPPSISVLALQGLLKLEKSGLRGQAVRGGEETVDRTRMEVAKLQSGELRLQDADHSEVYGALSYYAGRRLGLSELHAIIFGDAMAYLLSGWSQTHTDGRYMDRLVMEFKKIAGSPPEGGFLWSDLHSLASRKGFQVMLDKARQIGTSVFR
jgi:hypothetical protein